MDDKPTTIDGYGSESVSKVTSTCLYVATKLTGLLKDIVIVGGLAPALLVDQQTLPWGMSPHAGTMDLDMGLSLALFNEQRYRELSERLRRAGLKPSVNRTGNQTRQTWTTSFESGPVTLDFLIAPSSSDEQGGGLRNLEPDFAAFIVHGLQFAFQDRRQVTLTGRTPVGEQASRDVWVCGPGAFTVLKALAFGDRGEGKDAYDLFYVWQGLGIEEVAQHIETLGDSPLIAQALGVLKRDFTLHDGIGPSRAAEFMGDRSDDAIKADVVSLAEDLLARL
ncbi:MAG: hypothetical protein F4X58_04450 [Chloroflexi bacterium]|nr:hypothetical protein [Chloroflexota bacterium]MYC01152.1 hypothetical protein [Chloroflexota bacterium]